MQTAAARDNSLFLDGETAAPGKGRPLSADDAALFRRAIAESHTKKESIASAIDTSPSYLSRILSGEKRPTGNHVALLPRDVRGVYDRLRVEADGYVVMEQDPIGLLLAEAQSALARAQMLLGSSRTGTMRQLKAELP
jgi:hypothetical protein